MIRTAPSAEHRTKPPKISQAIPPLCNGDHLDQPTYHKLYEQTAEGFRAQLIGGIVYVASPVYIPHSNLHTVIQFWLCFYSFQTRGVGVINQTTTILGPKSEPEPDGGLFIFPEYGGSCQIQGEKTLLGAPELLIEVANSSIAIDLKQKKKDYLEAGVREYLVVIVPEKRIVWWTLLDDEYQEQVLSAEGIYRSAVFPGLWLHAESLWITPGQQKAEEPELLVETLQRGLASPEHAAFVTKLTAKAKKIKGKKR